MEYLVHAVANSTCALVCRQCNKTLHGADILSFREDCEIIPKHFVSLVSRSVAGKLRRFQCTRTRGAVQ
jgi:hypothetical protein